MIFYGFASFYVQAHTSCELRNSYIIFGAGVIENLTAQMEFPWRCVVIDMFNVSRIQHRGSFTLEPVAMTCQLFI